MSRPISQRVGTALLLAPLVLVITLYGTPVQFAGLCALAVLAGAWEWAAIAEPRRARWKLFALVLAALLLALCYRNIDAVVTLYIVGLSLLWWALALVLIIVCDRGWNFSPGLLSQAVIGMLVLVPAWVALVAMHAHPDLRGPVLVVCLFVVVWSADTGAYYTGRRWGRHKLARQVSPGKTLEGLFGAFVFGLAAALLGALLLLKMSLGELLPFLLVCAITIAVSVVGDLTESMVKRRGGVKDSGELLPGHGGALDRIDSLTAASPVFFAGMLLLERA